jgi:ribosomal protein S18 acetylase RimI-like enzyme
MPITDAASYVERFYADRDRPPRIQVELGSPEEDALRRLGWEPVPGRDSHFLLSSLARVRRVLRTAPAGATIRSDGSRVVVEIHDTGDSGDAGEGADVMARGEAGVDGDWLGIHNLVVQPAYRRRGLAKAVLGELLAWGAERGAGTVWLHVQTDNEPALALYASLGFSTHHTCRYLTPGG